MRIRILAAPLTVGLALTLLTGCQHKAPVIYYPASATPTVAPSSPAPHYTAIPATQDPSATPVPFSSAPTSAAPTASSTPTARPDGTPRSAAVRTARKQLASLTVAEANYSVTYNRTGDFGPAWEDVDHNGCDTRDDILRRDLTHITYRADDPGCTVATGTLADPYTGRTIHFTRGVRTSLALQIDHLWPLHYVAEHGAERWTFAKREAYANDPLVLLAVDGPANEQKSDSGPADWLPENEAYHCTYAEKLTAVAAKYKFTISRRDSTALGRILAACK